MERRTNWSQYPLNELLGSTANVAILRLLAYEVASPTSAPDLATRTGLTVQGVRKSLQRLTETGFVLSSGAGRSRLYSLRPDDRLSTALKQLFAQELSRYENLLQELRNVTQGVTEVRAAWIEQWPVHATDPIEIIVVAEAASMALVRAETRTRLSLIEAEYDQIIEIRIFTRTDAPNPDMRSVTPLAGIVGSPASMGARNARTHGDLDDDAMRMSATIARLLRDDPTLRRRAARHIERLVSEGQGNATQDLIEWGQVLNSYSDERLRDFLVSDSSRAQRLRQSSPFFAVLNGDERDLLVQYLGRGS